MHWIDPDFLPDYAGTIERFIVNPGGKIDGLVLTYDADKFLLVHLPPHLDQKIEALIRPGDEIRVRGIRPRGADMVSAVALTARDGQTIVDDGPGEDSEKPGGPKHPPVRMDVSGTVRLSLHGPKGELRGALLEHGSVVRIGPKEAAHFGKLLRPGATIAVRGDGRETKHGRVVAADEIGTDLHHLEPAKAAKPDDHEHKHKDKPKHKEPHPSAHADSAA